MKYLDYIKRQIKILSGKTNLIRFPIEKRLQEIEREKKQKQKKVKRVWPVFQKKKTYKKQFNI